MRKLFGIGTPRGLQPEGDTSSLAYLIQDLLATLWILLPRAMRILQSCASIALDNRRWPPGFAPAA
jgi:hypothetical protein